MAVKPLILIADTTLAVQAQLGDLLSGDLCLVSVLSDAQLRDWMATPLTQEPHLLILDASLPTEGLEAFCQSWRSAPATRNTDIIVMGPADDDSEFAALMAGAADYLRKPLNPLLCLARVKAFMRQRELRDQLEAISLTDSLTGLANRRYLDDFLQSEWRQAQRVGGNIGMIMVDIDHFKSYNDFYGHPQGDRCLAQVAHVLKSSVQRPRDLVARYGGEEFAIILPNVQKSGLNVVAERIRAALKVQAIPHSASQVSSHVTLSMGLAWCEPHAGENPTLLVEAADEALYSAKGQGRDRMSDTVDLAFVRQLLTH
ncbi:diguanylate cyclase domain-containing protein [Thalassolituus sp. LLYu03]|uniref:diguanylate cyclase domain-containing protein n=1 Tax=Thalassolituus sp. LLYu03 TaxID=3421656 RepID=UPI003D29CF3D